MSTKIPYPKVNGSVPADFTKVSSTYKTKVIQVFFSMLLFVVSYFVILIATGALVYYSFYGAILLLTVRIHFVTVLAALGILFMGGLLAYFMLKFLFSSNKEETDHLVELKREDEPEFFAFIEEVCKECKTTFPKKIFVSADVNARVFYNSGFWSMFLPVRKNLEIGAGLMSGINMSEFKNIVAHEFGHFSQSSTRLGSYVYRINRIIYNLVNENDGWNKTVQQLSQIHGIVNLFLMITSGIVRGIIWTMDKLYGLVNIPYMALSREMEFHADSVAVSVTGSQFTGTALYRADFASDVFSRSTQIISDKFKESKTVPDNFFDMFSYYIAKQAKFSGFEVEDGLPVINQEIIGKNQIPNRVFIKNLWASHPSTHERDLSAHRVYVEGEVVTASPWVLFSNPEALQKQITKNMYAPIEAGHTLNYVSSNEFKQFINDKIQYYTYKPEYHDYYDNAFYPMYKMEDVVNEQLPEHIKSLSDIFTPDAQLRIKKYIVFTEDYNTLQAIKNKELLIKKFEFDGKMYKAKHAEGCVTELENEVMAERDWLISVQKNIYLFFYDKLSSIGTEKQAAYKNVFALCERMATDIKDLYELRLKGINFFYDIQNGKYDDSQPTALINAVDHQYKTYTKYKDSFLDFQLAPYFDEKGLMKNYADEYFKTTIRYPHGIAELSNYLDDLTTMIENVEALRYKVFKLTMDLQDEWIDKTAATQADAAMVN